MTENTPDQLLMGGGASFFTWAAKNQLGQYVTKPYGQNGRTRVAGHIARIGTVEQQTDYNTRALLTWPDGKPKQQFAITLDVDWQNTSDWDLQNNAWVQVGPKDADDRQRGVMIKQSSALQGALRDAVKQSGAEGLQLGAYLVVELTAEVPGQGNPRKEFTVQYTAPAQNMMMGGQPQQQGPAQPQYAQPQQPYGQPVQQAPAPAPQQQYAQPQPQQAPVPQGQPQAQGPDPFAIAKRLLHELKLPPDQVAATTGLTVEQVQQIPPF